MRKSKRLAVVARLAYLREQQQLAQLHQSREEFNRQQESQRQLQEYRMEYLQGAVPAKEGEPVSRIVDAGLLENFTRFVSDLDHASELQDKQLQASAGRMAEENSKWQGLHARRESLEKLIQRSQLEESRDDEARLGRDAEELWLVNQRQKNRNKRL